MSKVHAAKKNYTAAAQVLERVRIESTGRQFTSDEKVDICVTVCEYWFEDDEAVNAEKYINKAAHYVHLVQNQNLVIRYKVCHSRILDSKRKFILAAFAYYNLSAQELSLIHI